MPNRPFYAIIMILFLSVCYLAFSLRKANQKIDYLQGVIIDLKIASGVEPDSYRQE